MLFGECKEWLKLNTSQTLDISSKYCNTTQDITLLLVFVLLVSLKMSQLWKAGRECEYFIILKTPVAHATWHHSSHLSQEQR